MQRIVLVLACCVVVLVTETVAASVNIQPSTLYIQNVESNDADVTVTFTKPDGTMFDAPVQNSGDPPLAVTIDFSTVPGSLSWSATASALSPPLVTDPPNGFTLSWYTGITVQNVGSSPASVTLDYQNHGSATATGVDATAQLAYDFACVPASICVIPSATSEATSATIQGNSQDGLPTGGFGGPVPLSSVASGPIVLNLGSSETGTLYVGTFFSASAAQSTVAIDLQGSISITAITLVPLPGAIWLLAGGIASLARLRHMPVRA